MNNKTTNALLIGILIGVSIFSAVKNGMTFWTFLPLILAYLLFFRNKYSKNKEDNKTT